MELPVVVFATTQIELALRAPQCRGGGAKIVEKDRFLVGHWNM